MYNFRIVLKYLNKTNTEFHSFFLPDERTLKVIIKFLLPDITAEEVTVELKS